MATQAELTEQLKAQTVRTEKIGTETRSLVDQVAQLLELIKNAPVSDELKSAADATDAQLQIVDDLVPDAPPAP